MEPPAWAKRLHEAQAGYLFLDELSTSPPAVQAAMLGVALERRIGDLVVPRAVQVVTAANPPERAADGWDLSPPLANRFLHISYTPEVERWIDGMTAGFSLPAIGHVAQPSRERTAIARAHVAAFIRSRPALLDAFPANASASGRAWPSRRTWTMTADVLALLAEDDADAAYIAASGLVGEGAAVEYLTWRREADLPDPALVIADPKQCELAIAESIAGLGHLAGVVGYSTGRGPSRPGGKAGDRWPWPPSRVKVTWPPVLARCSWPDHPTLVRRLKYAPSSACSRTPACSTPRDRLGSATEWRRGVAAGSGATRRHRARAVPCPCAVHGPPARCRRPRHLRRRPRLAAVP